MTLRIGILGAARIAPAACIKPARRTDGVEVVAIAARNPDKARAFAAKHAIPIVHSSYEALLADESIDAVYNPLPNGLHGRWTMAALHAGKHVLCEKPFTANTDEARTVAAAAEASGLVVFEAFHYRYHPLLAAALDTLASGEIGELRRVETSMCIPLPLLNDIRYDLGLAGGATMDIGCYAVHLWRTLSGIEPAVVTAKAKLLRAGIDRAMVAELEGPGDLAGTMRCALLSARLLSLRATVVGSDGELHLFNPLGPHVAHSLKVTTPRSTRKETFSKTTTYTFQMEAFRDAVVDGSPFPTTPEDAIRTMEVIDSIYLAAGLQPRQPTA
jgi:predicted dehydrogenase